jgi:hypothetical protein
MLFLISHLLFVLLGHQFYSEVAHITVNYRGVVMRGSVYLLALYYVIIFHS